MSKKDDASRAPTEPIEHLLENIAAMKNIAERSQAMLQIFLDLNKAVSDPFCAAPVHVVERLLKFRRKREAIFRAAGYGDVLFGEPAWDMLLELYAIQANGKRISVSKLCFVAGVPPTTALRYVSTLTEMGLVTRLADGTDGRRVWVELSAVAHDVINMLLEA